MFFWNSLAFSMIQLLLLLLLLLSRFSCVRLCETPQMASYQAPLSLGFSRQEHWSGLPFPSPMHASEKWKWSRSVVSDSLRPHGLQPTRLLHPWDFPGKSTGVGCHCLLQMIQQMLAIWCGSSAFSKTSLNIWKFTFHVLLKTGLENFEHYFGLACEMSAIVW